MNSQPLTASAATAIADPAIAVGFLSLAGVLLGAVIAAIAPLVTSWIQAAPQRKLDKQRTRLLVEMLNDDRFPWRKISTLSRVIGADESTTMRLLIGLGARGSTKDDDMWGLLSRHPLKDIKE